MAASVQDLRIRLTVENGQVKASVLGAKNAIGDFTQSVQEGAGSANAALEGINQKLDTIGGHISTVEKLGAAFLTFHGLRALLTELVNVNVELQQLHYTLLAATGSTAAAEKEFQFLMDTANRLGVSVETMAHTYGTYAVAAKQAHISSAQARDTFLAVAEAGTVFHLSQQQMNSAMIALDQMMAQGVIRSQELRMQLGQNLPGSYEAFINLVNKKGLGDFNKLLEKGALDVQRFFPILTEAIRSTFDPEALAEASKGLNAELGRLKNEVLLLKSAFADSDFAAAFTPMVQGAALAAREIRGLMDGVGGSVVVWGLAAGAIAVAGRTLGNAIRTVRDYARAFGAQVIAERDAAAIRQVFAAQEAQQLNAKAQLRAKESADLARITALEAARAQQKASQLATEVAQLQQQVRRIELLGSEVISSERLIAVQNTLAVKQLELDVQRAKSIELTAAVAVTQDAANAAHLEAVAAEEALTVATTGKAGAATAAARATAAEAVATEANTAAMTASTIATRALTAAQGLLATATAAVVSVTRGLVALIGGLPGVIALAVIAVGGFIVKIRSLESSMRDLKGQTESTMGTLRNLHNAQAGLLEAQSKYQAALKADPSAKGEAAVRAKATYMAAIAASAQTAADWNQIDLNFTTQIGAYKRQQEASEKRINDLRRQRNAISFFDVATDGAKARQAFQLETQIAHERVQLKAATDGLKEAEEGLGQARDKNNVARRTAEKLATQERAREQREAVHSAAERARREATEAEKELTLKRATTAEKVKIAQEGKLKELQDAQKYQTAIDAQTGLRRAVDPKIRAEEQKLIDALRDEVVAQNAITDAQKAATAGRKADAEARREQAKEAREKAKADKAELKLTEEEADGLERINDITDEARLRMAELSPANERRAAETQRLIDLYEQLVQAVNKSTASDSHKANVIAAYTNAIKEAAQAMDELIDREEARDNAQTQFAIEDFTTDVNRDSALGSGVVTPQQQAEIEKQRERDRLKRDFEQERLRLAQSGITGAEYKRLLDEINLAEEAAMNRVQLSYERTIFTLRGLAVNAGQWIVDNLGNFVEMALDGNFKGIADAWKDMLKKMVAQFIANKIIELLDRWIKKLQEVKKANEAAQGSSGGGGKSGAGFWGQLIGAVVGMFGGKKDGGYMQGAGTGTSDSIFARLSNGEFVIQAEAVRKYGRAIFELLNNMALPKAPAMPRFATGGMVGGGSAGLWTHGGGGEGTEVNINVHNHSGEPVDVKRRRGMSGQEEIDLIIGRVAESVQNNGPVGNAIQRTFGVGRRGVGRG